MQLFGGLMPTATSIFSGSARRLFDILGISIRNGTFSQTLSIFQAGSTLFVGLFVCMRSVVRSLLRYVTSITGDSASASIDNFFATLVVAVYCSKTRLLAPQCARNFRELFISAQKLALMRNVLA